MSTPAATVTGVDFVSIPVRDMAAARAYYADVLGLAPSKLWQRDPDQPPLGAEFETGTVTLALIDPTALGFEFSPNVVPIALQVEDAAAARADLEAKGVELADTIDSGVCHIVPFRDPDGNALMLHHRYAPQPQP
jgi:catechol 2,3-dioxygenase-like lactoylglutathione lyase family enzyme